MPEAPSGQRDGKKSQMQAQGFLDRKLSIGWRMQQKVAIYSTKSNKHAGWKNWQNVENFENLKLYGMIPNYY